MNIIWHSGSGPGKKNVKYFFPNRDTLPPPPACVPTPFLRCPPPLNGMPCILIMSTLYTKSWERERKEF